VDEVWNFMQNIKRITVMWSRSKTEEEFQYGGHFFSPFDDRDVTEYETIRSIAAPQLPSWYY